MSISMIGIDYNKANVDIRAMFSFTKKNATAAMERLKKIPGIQGCVILSTCNRMELWASTKADWNGTLLEELCKIKEVDPTQYGEYFVERNEEEAVDHLFHLTSGLKSMILAEDQIITQVKDALTLAREAFVTDNVLEVLFRKAVTAGKKVKTNVIFSRANQTAMDQAIEMLKERKFPLSDARCMVIGNGEMGKLAAQSLKRTGADVTVTVRQYRSGVVTIPMGCSRINYGERLNFLPGCDLVVSATASPNYTLTKEQVKEAFGELRFMGADNCYRYDKDSKKKTEEVEALKLHLGSMKLGNSVDIRLEATELPKIEPYAVVELEEPVYAPYVQRGNFPVLVEKITCKGIRPVANKNM